jgi:hypothetical protein
MRLLITIALFCVLTLPGARQFVDDVPAVDDVRAEGGPGLLAEGKGYAIYRFRGTVEPVPGGPGKIHTRPVLPGVVIFHTNLATRNATWLVSTGVRSVPTRRITYSISRVIGLFLTDTQLAVARYDVGRVFSCRSLRPEMGTYRVVVFDRKTGKRRLEHVLIREAHRPAKVPEETTALGVIQPTRNGFTVLGQPFVVQKDGAIAVGA